MNVSVEKSKTVSQAPPTAHRYPTLRFFSWQKRSETVTVEFAKHCGGNVKLRRIGGIVAVTWMWDPGGGALGILAFVLLPAGT